MSKHRVPTHSVTTPAPSRVNRRTVFAGAGAVGALAAAAALLPKEGVTDVALAQAPTDDAATAGGYQVTPHVLRYYQTAKV